jgi:DNA-binding transcriptional MerR regulator
MSIRFPLVKEQSSMSFLSSRVLPIDEVARLTDIQPDLVVRFVDWGLIDPVETNPEPCFEVSVVLRIRRILRIHHDLGVNWAGIGVVMDLLAKIDDLEQEIARLKTGKKD